MKELFVKCLEMSLSASTVILAVLLLRFALKKAPKVYSYALWALVLIKLLCPIEIKSPIGLTKAGPAESGESIIERLYIADGITAAGIYSENAISEDGPEGQAVLLGYDQGVEKEKSGADVFEALAIVWACGAAATVLFGAFKMLLLKKRLVGAVPVGGRVYLADHISTAFIVGVIRPRIYVPSTSGQSDREYVTEHERWHLKRGDNIWRMLGALAAAVHWFNPLVWLALRLSGQDMEMSCDEHVLKKLGETERQEYSRTLLRFSTGRYAAPAAIAFGQGNVKGRIKNALNFKEPRFWICAGAIVVILVAAAVLMTVRGDASDDSPAALQGTYAFDGTYDSGSDWSDIPEWLTLEDARMLQEMDTAAFYRIDEKGELYRGDYASNEDGEMVVEWSGNQGKWKKIKLTRENFVDCFHYDPKWRVENLIGSRLLGDNKNAWRIDLSGKDTINPEFIMILEQKDGGIYLAFGKYRFGIDDRTAEDMFIYRLRRIVPYVEPEQPAVRNKGMQSYNYPHGYSYIIYRDESQEETGGRLEVFVWDKYESDIENMNNLGVQYWTAEDIEDGMDIRNAYYEYPNEAKRSEFITPDTFELPEGAYKIRVTYDGNESEVPYKAELVPAE